MAADDVVSVQGLGGSGVGEGGGSSVPSGGGKSDDVVVLAAAPTLELHGEP